LHRAFLLEWRKSAGGPHEYAKSALLAFESLGDTAAQQQQTRDLIAEIGRV